MSTTNPLLENTHLPAFDRIKPEHVEPAIDEILSGNRNAYAVLLEQTRGFTWDTLLSTIEEHEDRLNRAWSPVNHLHAVADRDELRTVYNACLTKLSEYETELRQNETLYLAFKQISEGPEFTALDAPRKKVIENAMREFRLAGIDLEKDKQGRFKEIKLKLDQLHTRFEENLLDATNAWVKHITNSEELSGLPESALALAAQTAKQKGKPGWVFTLDFPSYYPVMQYADNQELRREMYEAYVTRASDQGPDGGKWDNSAIMVEILELRNELATVLGFSSYAHYSLERKMAESPESVTGFLQDLVQRSRPVAEREFNELTTYASTHCRCNEINAWDVAYFSEKMRRHLFEFSQEELRPYFPVPRVLTGMFSVVKNLYGYHLYNASKALASAVVEGPLFPYYLYPSTL